MADQVDYDIAIVGGGLAGAALANALSALGLRIVMIEAVQRDITAPSSLDIRTIALSYISKRIFKGIGVWEQIQKTATAIKTIHVSEQGQFGFAHLSADEEGVDALGYVISAHELKASLYQQLKQRAVQQLVPAKVEGFDLAEDAVELTLRVDNKTTRITTSLLVGADGGDSHIRKQLGIRTTRQDYHQTAILTNIETDKAHQGMAYERFSATGPLALLPMATHHYGVVHTVKTSQTDEFLALDEKTYLDKLQRSFGYRAGRFLHMTKRRTYPLTLLIAHESSRPRVALLGNAMHTLHPISGQGFNLALRDAADLVEVIADALSNKQDIGDHETLKAYEYLRQQDQRRVVQATDGLARLFTNPLQSVRFARNLGLLLIDMLPGIKHQIVSHAMGMQNSRSQLARGLGLDKAHE